MKNNEKIFSVISILSGLVLLIVVTWTFAKYPSEQALGERFVKDEILIFPYYGNGIYFKPVTIIVISAFIFWACALEALRSRLTNLSVTAKQMLFILFCLVAFMSGYEVIWNFLFWNSTHILNPNQSIDTLNNQLYPVVIQQPQL